MNTTKLYNGLAETLIAAGAKHVAIYVDVPPEEKQVINYPSVEVYLEPSRDPVTFGIGDKGYQQFTIRLYITTKSLLAEHISPIKPLATTAQTGLLASRDFTETVRQALTGKRLSYQGTEFGNRLEYDRMEAPQKFDNLSETVLTFSTIVNLADC